MEQIKTKQAYVLINKGLENKINCNIAKLLLASHGYHDRAEIANYEMAGKGTGDAITITFPSHEAIQLERINEERAALEKEKEEFKRARISIDNTGGEKDNNDNEQQ